MVSKASEDLPEPLRPVMTVRLLRGISTSMFLRLCWRAPCTVICFSIGKPKQERTDIYCHPIRGGGAMRSEGALMQSDSLISRYVEDEASLICKNWRLRADSKIWPKLSYHRLGPVVEVVVDCWQIVWPHETSAH